MATTSDIKNGLCIKFNDKLCQIIEFQHVKPGKGSAFVRTKMRLIETGKIIENTFSAGHKIDIVRIENREYQFLYKENDNYVFMNNEDYEQINISGKLINKKEFLIEGMNCSILFHVDEETPLMVELPIFIINEIVETEPGMKTDSSTQTKPAKLLCGAVVKVPYFINVGEVVKIDTRDGSYVERMKEKL